MSQLPRVSADARHSIHPDLRSMAGYALGSFGEDGSGAAHNPYPTREQYAKVESDYRRALEEYNKKLDEAAGEQGKEGESAAMPVPPVRQPPTMLAAMQRPDLTAAARKSILQKIAPPITNLEKKYKVVFNSDARRNPSHTSTNDFTVDVTSDLLPVRINGFEIVGYSLPQSEWSIEPYENSIPSRFGWCAYPGSRAFGLVSRTFDLNLPAYPPGEPFSYNGVPQLIYAEMPLVRNPITRIEVVPAMGAEPKRVLLTFARRVGTCLDFLIERTHGNLRHPFSILELQDVGLQNAVGNYPGRFELSRADAIVQDVQLPYMNRYVGEGILPPEPLLEERELYVQPAAAEESLYTLAVVDPVFTQYFQDNTEVAVTAQNAIASLGFLHMRPPATAVEVGTMFTVQLNGIVTQRLALQDLALNSTDPPTKQGAVDALRGMLSPVVDVNLFQMKPGNRSTRTTTQLASHSHRFRLSVGWVFGNFPIDVPMWYKRSIDVDNIDPVVLNTMVQPIMSTAADAVAQSWGFPKGITAELVLSEATRSTYACLDPPTLGPDFTTDCTAVPENVPLSEYFQSLNTTALSMKFLPHASNAPNFEIRIETADGTPTDVQVPAGEYRPWPLAVAITNAIRNYPALRPLQIVVTPSMLEAYGNTAAGFRFASTAPIPQTFNLRFDQLSLNPNLIQPTRLGYRGIAYTGASMYDPKLLNVMDDPYAGFTTPVTFPATEVGNGVPSPMPIVPFFLSAFNNKRLQITHIGYSAVDAVLDYPSGSPPVALSAPPASSLTIPLLQPALFSHTQSITLQTGSTGLDPSGNVPLTFQSPNPPGTGLWYAGVQETPAPTALTLAGGGWSLDGSFAPLPGPGRSDPLLSAAAIQSIVALIHNNTATLDGLTLGQTFVDLWGKAGQAYGGGTAPPPQDGDYRILAASSSLTLPPLSTIDAYVTAIATHTNTRASFNELGALMVRLLIEAGGSGALAGNNGGVSTLTLGDCIIAYSSASQPVSYMSDLLADMVTVLFWKLGAGAITATTITPLSVPAALDVSKLYYVELDQPNGFAIASPGGSSFDAAQVEVYELNDFLVAFKLLPGCCVGDPGTLTFTASITYGSGSHSPVPINTFYCTGPPGPLAGVPLTSGTFVGISYDTATLSPSSTPPLIAPTEAEDIQVDTVNGFITFTLKQNIPLQTLTLNFDNVPGPGTSAYTIAVVDSVATTIGKAVFVAQNYRTSLNATALLSLTGTNRYPFNIEAALDNLLGPSATQGITSLEEIVDVLIDAPDPGVSSSKAVTLVPATMPFVLFDDLATSPFTTALNLQQDSRDVAVSIISFAFLAPDTALAKCSITRINENPYSIDFISRISRGIRPERMGFQEDEYTADLNRVSYPPGIALYTGTIGSAIDIERASSPYVLMSIQVNGTPTPAPITQRADGVDLRRIEYYDGSTTYGGSYQDYAYNGNVISISTSDDPALDRQIINATAYVQLGGDGSTLRMLDRQDDRSPIMLPTSTYVNLIRFVIMRPDGTLYNFHGKRTMIALRFMSWPDNPNFLAAASSSK
jgi:hypothetical protein